MEADLRTRAPVRAHGAARLLCLVLLVCAFVATGGCGGTANGDDTTGATVSQPVSAGGETPVESPSPTETSVPDESKVFTIGRGQEHRVTADGSTVTIHCDGGGDIYVLADRATVMVTGRGEDLEVRGSHATVQAERMDEVDIPGAGNDVRIMRANEADVDGDRNTVRIDRLLELDIDGHRNVVKLGAVAREVEVSRNDNRVTWRSGNPRIDDEGRGNKVARQ